VDIQNNDMPLESSQTNTNVDNIVPIDGYIYHSELIIISCPFCAKPHRHGGGYSIGEKTIRVSHCGGKHAGVYEIHIVGKLASKEHTLLFKKLKINSTSRLLQ